MESIIWWATCAVGNYLPLLSEHEPYEDDPHTYRVGAAGKKDAYGVPAALIIGGIVGILVSIFLK